MFRPTVFAAGLLIACSAGCASVGVRSGWYSERAAVYPATTVDAGVVAFVAAYPFRPYTERWFPPDAQEGLVFLFLPASIIDLPVAIVVDTLFLPIDVYRLRKKETDAESESGRPELSES